MKKLEFILVLTLVIITGCSKGDEKYFAAGNDYMIEGEYDNAIICFQKAVKLNPDYKDAYYNMGISYNSKDNPNKVIECYMNYLKINNVEAMASYESLEQMKVTIDNAWAEIDNQLKRRYDLIPYYLESVKGYAKHEKEAFAEVVKARNIVGQAQTRDESIKANNQLAGAFSRLLLIVERYPDLKAKTNFIRLHDELSGTENRIVVARRKYNESVRNFNRKIIEFPEKILAGMLELKKETFFEKIELNKETSKVKF